MITISLCLIVRDEEEIISRCLASVEGIVDEIIVVDTGSVDSTKKIANAYTNKIYDFEWKDDFSAARNFSFSKATKEYILWLDADEFLDIENKEKLRSLKEGLNNEIDAVSMQTYICVDENNNPRIIGRRNRLVKRSKNYKWVGFIHEYIEVYGKCYESDICIIHDKIKENSSRNIEIYRKNIKQDKKFRERDLYYYGKELYYNRFYDEAIEILNKYLNIATWEEEIVDALCKIGECYLHENNQEKAREYFYKTFEYVEPTGDVLYNIAISFDEQERYYQAIVWYEIILRLPLPEDCSQCINLGCWRFKPHLNLCYCYFEIDDLPRAYYHHKKCAEINPLDECVISNEKIFRKIMKDNTQKT